MIQKDWKCVSIFNELIKERIGNEYWFIYNKIVITNWKKRMKYYGPYLIKNWVKNMGSYNSILPITDWRKVNIINSHR